MHRSPMGTTRVLPCDCARINQRENGVDSGPNPAERNEASQKRQREEKARGSKEQKEREDRKRDREKAQGQEEKRR